jgi:hypothetical protein
MNSVYGKDTVCIKNCMNLRAIYLAPQARCSHKGFAIGSKGIRQAAKGILRSQSHVGMFGQLVVSCESLWS